MARSSVQKRLTALTLLSFVEENVCCFCSSVAGGCGVQTFEDRGWSYCSEICYRIEREVTSRDGKLHDANRSTASY